MQMHAFIPCERCSRNRTRAPLICDICPMRQIYTNFMFNNNNNNKNKHNANRLGNNMVKIQLALRQNLQKQRNSRIIREMARITGCTTNALRDVVFTKRWLKLMAMRKLDNDSFFNPLSWRDPHKRLGKFPKLPARNLGHSALAINKLAAKDSPEDQDLMQLDVADEPIEDPNAFGLDRDDPLYGHSLRQFLIRKALLQLGLKHVDDDDIYTEEWLAKHASEWYAKVTQIYYGNPMMMPYKGKTAMKLFWNDFANFYANEVGGIATKNMLFLQNQRHGLRQARERKPPRKLQILADTLEQLKEEKFAMEKNVGR